MHKNQVENAASCLALQRRFTKHTKDLNLLGPRHQIEFYFLFDNRLAAAWSQAGRSAKYTDTVGVERQNFIIRRLLKCQGMSDSSASSVAFD